MKTDKSTKVGGRRNKAPEAQKSSMQSMSRGNAIALQGGRLVYTNKGKKAKGRPVKHVPTRRPK